MKPMSASYRNRCSEKGHYVVPPEEKKKKAAREQIYKSLQKYNDLEESIRRFVPGQVYLMVCY